MKLDRARARGTLDTRVAGLGERLGVLPPGGWVKAMRDALGMSSYQLAKRMRLSQSRIAQLEREEVGGSIRLAVLRRLAEAMHCTLVYALVPNMPLEDIVLRQAYLRAAAQLGIVGPDQRSVGDPDVVPHAQIDELEDLTLRYVDHRDLWS